MDKRAKILLGLLLGLLLIGGGYAGYIFMTSDTSDVQTAPVKQEAKPAAPAPGKKSAESQPAPAPGTEGQPAAPGAPAAKAAPAVEEAAPAIKVTEKGKELVYESPELFIEKTSLNQEEIKAFSAKALEDAQKAHDAIKDAGKKKELARAAAKLDMMKKLSGLVMEKFPAKPAETAPVYSSLGKRDPFMSPAEVPKVYPPVPPTAKPLERVPTESLKVQAIIWNEKGYRAMVVTPDGRGYTVKVGDALGNKKGRIVEITKKKLSVVEKIPDILGDIETRNIVLKLH